MEQTENENIEELKNENPAFFTDILYTISDIFQNYGWIILFISIGILYIYIRLYPYIQKYINERNEQEYSAKYHKDSDLFNERQIQMEKAREKMQEKMFQSSMEYKLKMEAKELRRRQELEEKYNNDPNKGNRLGSKTLKTDYNPLMESNGTSYRAPKRSACGKGCGQ